MAVVANQSLSIISTDANNNTAVVEYNVTAKTSGESWQGYTQEGTFYIDGVKYTNKYTLPENTTTTVFSKELLLIMQVEDKFQHHTVFIQLLHMEL